MKSQDGTTYAQNYDVIVKWPADALRGETLETIGVQTERIEEVFGFEPVDIAVKAGRVDVMARDETGEARSRFAEEVLRFESALFQAEKVSARLLAATLIISNKLIDKQILRQIWEDVKMLDILEIAREEGMKEGEMLGLQKGKMQGLQEGMLEMMIELLVERFGVIPARLSEQIRGIHNQDTLKGVFHQSLKCRSLQELETLLLQVI